jgi:hypothetical protein
MSTRVGRLTRELLRPRLVTALATVAWIGGWKGRSFLDDDLDLSDVADFVPAEAPSPSAETGARSVHADSGPSHSVAA